MFTWFACGFGVVVLLWFLLIVVYYAIGYFIRFVCCVGLGYLLFEFDLRLCCLFDCLCILVCWCCLDCVACLFVCVACCLLLLFVALWWSCVLLELVWIVSGWLPVMFLVLWILWFMPLFDCFSCCFRFLIWVLIGCIVAWGKRLVLLVVLFVVGIVCVFEFGL